MYRFFLHSEMLKSGVHFEKTVFFHPSIPPLKTLKVLPQLPKNVTPLCKPTCNSTCNSTSKNRPFEHKNRGVVKLPLLHQFQRLYKATKTPLLHRLIISNTTASTRRCNQRRLLYYSAFSYYCAASAQPGTT